MSEKKESSLEVGHSRLAEASGVGSQHHYVSKKQFKSKRDKKGGYLQYPGGRPYTGSGGQSYQRKPRALYPSGGEQRWSDQRRERQEGGVNEEGAPSPRRSVGRPGSEDVKKKSTPISLNHLLNFTVASHERHSGRGPLPPRRRRRRGTRSFNKEQFLQANCQFVVSASGDYGMHSGDPDRLVDWDRIEQVRLFCHQIPSCPICLYPPRAAKISRCGHVYCWSCVLHYLSLGEKKWRKCPICYESIYKSDLKSVMALSSLQYRVGDTITMNLMMREKGTTESFPKSHWAGRKQGLAVLGDTAHNHFVKLLAATPTQVLEEITGPERRELTAQLESLEEDEISEQCFVESAIEELKARELVLRRAQELHQEVEEIAEGLDAVESAVTHDTIQKAVTQKPVAVPSSKGSSWEAYADDYFDGEFEAPFSESEEDEEEDNGEEKSVSVESSESPLVHELESESSSAQEESPQARKPAKSNPLPSHERTTTTVTAVQSLAIGGTASQEDPLPMPRDCNRLSTDSSPQSDLSLEQQESSPESSPLSHTGAKTSPTGSPPHSPTNGKYIYFYQASDGQHLYIHPVNARCLVKEYGSLEHCPDEITACIVEMEQLSMSEEVRDRYRYLSHLPLTCEFVLCELELRPPLLSREILRMFSDELQRRRQKRLKKKREEKRRERKAEARSPPPKDVFPALNFPRHFTPEKFHDLLALHTSPSLPHQSYQESPVTARQPTAENGSTARLQANGVPLTTDTPSAPSFAETLRGKPPPVWPIKPASRPQVAGAAPIRSSSLQSGRQKQEEEVEQPAVPSFQEAFNDALLSASVAAQNCSGGKPGNKTAKKGKKKLVLFSTGGARGAS